jgi:hypothetical protein
MVTVSIRNAPERFESWGNGEKSGIGLGSFGVLTADLTGRNVLDGLQATGLPIESRVSERRENNGKRKKPCVFIDGEVAQLVRATAS